MRLNSITLLLFILLGSVILGTLPHQSYILTESNRVEQGFWAKYRFERYNGLWNSDTERINVTKTGVYIVEFEIVSFYGTNITLRESLRDENGLLIKSGIISGDPYYPIYSKYSDEGFLEHDINIFMIPPGLKSGDAIPDPVWVPDKDDVTRDYPWSQRINYTTCWIEGGFNRQANKIEWNKTTNGLKPSGPFMAHTERSSYYDVRTGIMLGWCNIHEKIYYDWGSIPMHAYNSIHNYTLIDSSLHEH